MFALMFTETTPDNSLLGMLPMLLLLAGLGLLLFFTSRSNKKKERETQDMRNGLQVGDEVTTIGGIIGKVVSIKDPTCIIETGRDGTTIRILKTAIKTVDVPASITIEAATPKKEQSAEEKTEAAPEEAPKKEEKKRGIFGKKK